MTGGRVNSGEFLAKRGISDGFVKVGPSGEDDAITLEVLPMLGEKGARGVEVNQEEGIIQEMDPPIGSQPQ